MSEITRILIADDEAQITRVLRRSLQVEGYDVRTAPDGSAALDIFHQWLPDLVITDLCMPNMDGLQLCYQLREISSVPIIVLSVKGEEQTKVKALDAGADDYVTKPFGMDELLARIRATLRRVHKTSTEEEKEIVIGDFHVDLAAHTVSVRGQNIHLTPKEFELLTYLLNHVGKVITHRKLLSAIWGGNYVEQTEYLRVFVGQLRKKIEPDPAKPIYILTEPWIGYRFNPGG